MIIAHTWWHITLTFIVKVIGNSIPLTSFACFLSTLWRYRYKLSPCPRPDAQWTLTVSFLRLDFPINGTKPLSRLSRWVVLIDSEDAAAVGFRSVIINNCRQRQYRAPRRLFYLPFFVRFSQNYSDTQWSLWSGQKAPYSDLMSLMSLSRNDFRRSGPHRLKALGVVEVEENSGRRFARLSPVPETARGSVSPSTCIPVLLIERMVLINCHDLPLRRDTSRFYLNRSLSFSFTFGQFSPIHAAPLDAFDRPILGGAAMWTPRVKIGPLAFRPNSFRLDLRTSISNKP